LIRGILVILSWFYGAAVVLRNAAFHAGLLSVRKAGVPVISVGNMTAGGTGKTPLVEYLVGQCLSRNIRVAVVSRGYGRTSSGVTVVSDGRALYAAAETGGDEPVQIARRFPAAIVVVGERRVEAATRAVKDLGAGLVIMDDGFQHRYLHRDLDIVVVDAGKDVRHNPLLPRGTRREPLHSFRRAGVVMFSRIGAPEQLPAATRDLAPWFSGPVAGMTSVPDGFRTLDGVAVDPALIQQGIGFAFCGIGDPEGFLTSLRAIGVRISAHDWYPDHHRFTERDMQNIRKRAAEHGASFLMTTEKDAMRLQALASAGSPQPGFLPIYALRIRVEIVGGADEFHQLINTCCSMTKTLNQ
jgi:tetraacyldisaccharide 4'-kinase